MWDAVLWAITLIGIPAIVISFFRRAKKSEAYYHHAVDLTFDKMLNIVKDEMAELAKEDTFAGMSDADLYSSIKVKNNVINALKMCVYGIDSDKELVTDLIMSIIEKTCPEDSDILGIIDFTSPDLPIHYKFEILMYHYSKTLGYGRDALKTLINKYDLHRPKRIIEDETHDSYIITAEEIEDIYAAEDIELFRTDMINILAILLFQRYKGFGVIDTIRAQNINGVNIGTSGSIIEFFGKKEHVASNSIWINFGGRYIHMRFLDMGNEEETRRIVQLIARWNSPGPLTEKRGYLVNTMYDKSRVLAVRPPLSEYWAVFIRKFEINPLRLHQLIYKDYITNWEVAEDMIKFLMMGQITTAFTGRQGSGKTTMMAGAIEHISAMYTIRVIEMAPELYLREMYPERNILSLQETEFVSAAQAQDALKKSDGAVSLFGEVATDDVAMRMIQTAQVASLFTIFSHHANTAADLVYALRNSVANVGNITNIKTAEDQVVSVLKVNVHLDYDTTGKRFIERFTEIVRLEEGVPYPEIRKNNLQLSELEMRREFYTRSTDRKTFETFDLITYNKQTDTYEVKNIPSTALLAHMLNCVPQEHLKSFQAFLSKWFFTPERKAEAKKRSKKR